MGQGRDVLSKFFTLKGIIGFAVFIIFESASNLIISYLKAISGIDKITDIVNLGLFKFPKQLVFTTVLTIVGMVVYNALPLSKMVNKFIEINRNKL